MCENFNFNNIEDQYNKNQNLKKEDVNALLDWSNKQPHLPKINELQAMMFLHSCYYRNELAKKTIDHFFTIKTAYPDIFKNKTMKDELIENVAKACIMTALPQKNPDNYLLFLVGFLDGNPDLYNFPAMIKLFDMVAMTHFYQNALDDGFVILFDCSRITLAHVTKTNPLIIKKLMDYLQEAMPMRLKGLYFFNLVPFMDKIIALVKLFLKKELQDCLHTYETAHDLPVEVIPRECLPEDYGGKAESNILLQGKIKEKLYKNEEFFKWEDGFLVDNKKRIGDLPELEGTFKKLDID